MNAARAKRILTAVTAGAAGGAVADSLNLPLAWMLGAMAGNLAAIAAGLSPGLPMYVRRAVISVIGVYLGASFTRELLDDLAGLVSSLSFMLIYVAVLTFLAKAAFQHLLRTDGRTALCAAIPGAYSLAITLASEKGDAQSVTIIQTLRIVLIVISIPLLARYYVPPPDPPATLNIGAMPMTADGLRSGILLFAMALPAAALGILFKLRVTLILALSLCTSAAAHAFLLPAATMPREPVDVALMLLGASIAGSFTAFRTRPIARALSAGLAVNTVGIALAAAFAAIGAATLNLPFWALLLAISPGGIAEISLIALTLNIDPAFVAIHQAFRVLVLIFIMPPLATAAERQPPPP